MAGASNEKESTMMYLTIYVAHMDGEGDGPAPFHGYRYRKALDDEKARAVVDLMGSLDDAHEMIDGPCRRYEVYGETEDILRPLLEAVGIAPDFGLLPGLTRRSEIVVELVD